MYTHHESSGGIISDDLMSKDPETLPLLIRGVGTRLDVSTRETRLQGMRVGEAAAALGGQNLRFAELDDERGQNDDEATEAAAKGQEGEGVAKEGVFLSGAGGRVGRKGEDEKKGETKEDEETYSVGYGRGDYSGLGGDDDDVGSNMEAYDLWDEEEDLVAVAEPVYLDQLIERKRSAFISRLHIFIAFKSMLKIYPSTSSPCLHHHLPFFRVLFCLFPDLKKSCNTSM